ncbi:MAG TPA: NAD(P)-dependent oxidoreductase [Methylomirabilota bacterium]|nr:NAD(P)-dependent oxidoreductase [Methylomirabilota bacterium]
MQTASGDTQSRLPDTIVDESALDELLSRPSPALQSFIKTVSSPLVILGIGGKMGPSLAALALRAAQAADHPLEVIGVSRFKGDGARPWLEKHGVKTISCDLLDAEAVTRLPEAKDVIYLAGLKFGTAQNPSATWALNTLAPARVCERYSRSRIVALSTGNVYARNEVSRGGSIETDPLTPLGEYANAAVARERIFEFHSRRNGTSVALLRLFYAVELRYGVLVDIARKVHAGEPISLATGSFTCIWQRDANEMILSALALAASPPAVFNLCRPEIFSIRQVATRFGELMDRPPRFMAVETGLDLLGNPKKVCDALGQPPVTLETMLRWIAHWVTTGGRNLGKPTHFEVRDGNY